MIQTFARRQIVIDSHFAISPIISSLTRRMLQDANKTIQVDRAASIYLLACRGKGATK